MDQRLLLGDCELDGFLFLEIALDGAVFPIGREVHLESEATWDDSPENTTCPLVILEVLTELLRCVLLVPADGKKLNLRLRESLLLFFNIDRLVVDVRRLLLPWVPPDTVTVSRLELDLVLLVELRELNEL